MGRGRSGCFTTSSRKASHYSVKQMLALIQKPPAAPPRWLITPAQIEALQHLSNEQLAAAIPSPAARPSAPREQTLSSGHQEGSTPRENRAS